MAPQQSLVDLIIQRNLMSTKKPFQIGETAFIDCLAAFFAFVAWSGLHSTPKVAETFTSSYCLSSNIIHVRYKTF